MPWTSRLFKASFLKSLNEILPARLDTNKVTIKKKTNKETAWIQVSEVFTSRLGRKHIVHELHFDVAEGHYKPKRCLGRPDFWSAKWPWVVPLEELEMRTARNLLIWFGLISGGGTSKSSKCGRRKFHSKIRKTIVAFVCVWVFSSLYKPLSKNAFLSTSPTAKSGKVRQVNLPQGTLSTELQGAFDTEGIQSKIELPLGQYVHVAFWSLLPSDFKKKNVPIWKRMEWKVTATKHIQYTIRLLQL